MSSPTSVECQTVAADEVYRLSPRLDVVVYSEDEVRIRQGTWSDWTLTLHDDQRRGLLGHIFDELLAGTCRVDDLLGRPAIEGRVAADELVAFLDDLRRNDIVGDGSGSGHRHRPIGAGEPARSNGSAPSMAMIGDGPTATLLAGYLQEAAVDLRHATVRDGAFRDALEAACDGSDFMAVVLESLSPTVLTAANAVALERGIPWVATYSDGPLVVVGPIYVPGESGCYAEFEAQLLSVCPNRAELKAYWDALGGRTTPRGAPRWQGGLAASWLVEPLVDFLESGTSDLVGRATVFDVAQRRVERVRCLTLPRCPVCRGDRGGYNPWD